MKFWRSLDKLTIRGDCDLFLDPNTLLNTKNANCESMRTDARGHHTNQDGVGGPHGLMLEVVKLSTIGLGQALHSKFRYVQLFEVYCTTTLRQNGLSIGFDDTLGNIWDRQKDRQTDRQTDTQWCL